MEDNIRQVAGVILEEQTGLTLAQVSEACAVHAELIVELVDEGVLTPSGRDVREWRFTGIELRRARRACRLRRDLGLNLAGVALAIELLEELEALRGVGRS